MDRSRLVLLAKLAERTERFDEMVDHMKAVAQQPQELTVEERNLLSVAYKNVIGSRRASWRVISSIEQKGGNEDDFVVQSHKRKIETELEDICSDILEIIKNELIPNSESEEGKVFYYKMKGDYHRYLAEFQNGDVRKESAAKALEAYSSASSIATSNVPLALRLDLVLSLSVYYYEILNSSDRACHLAKQAIDDAMAEVDPLPYYCVCDPDFKKAMVVVQLLSDNLTQWSGQSQQGDQEAVEKDSLTTIASVHGKRLLSREEARRYLIENHITTKYLDFPPITQEELEAEKSSKEKCGFPSAIPTC